MNLTGVRTSDTETEWQALLRNARADIIRIFQERVPTLLINSGLPLQKLYPTKRDTIIKIKKEVFRLVTSVGQRKNSESPWGIKPQNFGFRAPILYHWAAETLRWARSITKFICHASCSTARISNVDSVMFVDGNKRDSKCFKDLIMPGIAVWENLTSELFYYSPVS